MLEHIKRILAEGIPEQVMDKEEKEKLELDRRTRSREIWESQDGVKLPKTVRNRKNNQLSHEPPKLLVFINY